VLIGLGGEKVLVGNDQLKNLDEKKKKGKLDVIHTNHNPQEKSLKPDRGVKKKEGGGEYRGVAL